MGSADLSNSMADMFRIAMTDSVAPLALTGAVGLYFLFGGRLVVGWISKWNLRVAVVGALASC
jgi:hypothetical protein